MTSGWNEAWHVHVGSTEGDGDAIGLGQIAARGPLIVVASRGLPNKNDADDGLHVIDGRRDAAERMVRRIPSPPNPKRGEGSSDAIGVALDGDFAVFGTYGGLVTKVRLDGLVAWVTEPLPERTRPGLPALIDVNGDGQLDAVVPIEPLTTCKDAAQCGPEWEQTAVALDGRSGQVIWRSTERPSFTLAGDATAATTSETGRAHRVVERQGEDILWLIDVNAPLPSYGKDNLARGIAIDLAKGRLRQPNSVSWRFPLAASYEQGAYLSVATESLGTATRSLLVTPSSPRVSTQDWQMRDPDPIGRFELERPLQSLPSVADVDEDGLWDVLVVAGEELHVLSTGASGDLARGLWRFDLQATGVPSYVDYPAAYASREGPRDLTRWLVADHGSPGGSFNLLLGALPQGVQLSREELRPAASGTALGVQAQTRCDEQAYGLNEGWLVVRRDAQWKRVPDAPWPVVALGCADGVLVTELPNGARYRIAKPMPVLRYSLEMLLALVAIGLAGIAYANWRRGHVPDDDHDPAAYARRAIVPDGPRTERKDALESQEQLLEGLINVLDNEETRPPVTVALYGAWGSGKSSVMHMLRSELRAKGRYIDVWFNAWRFQREAELAPALLQCVVDEVARQSDWLTRLAVIWDRIRCAKPREIALVLGPMTVLSLLLAVCIHSVSNGGVSAFNGTGAIVSTLALFAGAFDRVVLPLFKVFSLDPAKLLATGSSEQRIRFVREFAAEFEHISHRLPRGHRLIVFIDDLDRCAPDRIVNVLETLSMLADTGCGFFVLAIDPVTVRRSIELVYKDLLDVAKAEQPEEAANFGNRYLEKMITLGVSVPVLAAADLNPDARLAVKPARQRWDWIWKRLLPEPPLLVTLLLAAVVAYVGAGRTEMLESGLDAVGKLVFTQAPTAAMAPPAAPSAAPAASVVPQSAPTQAAPAPPSSALPPSPAAENAVASATQRARKQDKAAPPPLVTELDKRAPARARRISQIALGAIASTFLLAATALVLVVLAELVRRRRIRKSSPLGSDSDAFAAAFAKMKENFIDSPRNVVRFTNLARFLYPILKREALSEPAFAQSFFAALKQRWSGGADSPGADPSTVSQQLDVWLPREGARRNGAGGKTSESPPATSETQRVA